MKLRLYHHRDGARVAYREAGTGPGLAVLHSAGLSHRELEPIAEGLEHRFRLVLPDLPLHGDSEDRPRHPYTPEWFEEVMADFIRDTCGPRPLVGGHAEGALLLLRMVASGRLDPARIVLLPSTLHHRPERHARERMLRAALRFAALPGGARVLSHAIPPMFGPRFGQRLSARDEPGSADLLRHALGDLGGNANRVRAWRKAVRRWPRDARAEVLDAYEGIAAPVLLLWADRDAIHPVAIAEEALGLLPHADLRVLSGTGFLIAYDDPVGVAREIVAFCG
jgi:pimeloyl-ACP methyl ester carboxylesterase